MWQIDNTYYFLLLLIIPILGLLALIHFRWQDKAQKSFGTGNYLAKLAPDRSRHKVVLKTIVALCAIFMLILALVNPKIGTKTETVKRQGIDIVFAIDVSKSMLAEDIAPNRLEKTKQLASQIINNLGTDRIGIVGYAGQAFPMLPITTDYNMAKMYLREMNTDMVSSMGTALSDAIEVSSRFFDNPETGKVIILLSDGEDHGDGIAEAVELAKEKNISIITIALGSEEGGTIPMRENGRLVGEKKDFEGQTVITKMNPETLEEIAQATGGSFILGNHTKEVVDMVENGLRDIKKTDFESQQIAEFQSYFQWFLALALVLLIIHIFMTERKTAWVQKRNLFNDKS